MKSQPSVSGVYRIVHVPTGTTYIGQSQDISIRAQQHKAQLLNGTHRNKSLQDLCDKDGIDALEIEILEQIDSKVEMLIKENDWIRKYRLEGATVVNKVMNVSFKVKKPKPFTTCTRRIGAFSGSKAPYINIPRVLAESFGWGKGDRLSIEMDIYAKSLTLTKE